ncbi:MAG: arginine repressor [Planctomycetota bacterium]
MDRTARHALIRETVRRGGVASQDDLRARLARRGVDVTQATLSRDLRALGVVKGASGYLLPRAATVNGSAHQGPGTGVAAPLADALRRHLLEADAGESIVVLKTAPGHAQALAVELDLTPPAGTLGTVAGDDTIFVACRSRTAASAIAKDVRRIASGAQEMV